MRYSTKNFIFAGLFFINMAGSLYSGRLCYDRGNFTCFYIYIFLVVVAVFFALWAIITGLYSRRIGE